MPDGAEGKSRRWEEEKVVVEMGDGCGGVGEAIEKVGGGVGGVVEKGE